MNTQRFDFATLCIVDSSRAIEAASQIKGHQTGVAMKTYLHVELLSSSGFLYTPVGDPFYERCNPFNDMDPPSEFDLIQTESPENSVVIVEKLPIDKE